MAYRKSITRSALVKELYDQNQQYIELNGHFFADDPVCGCGCSYEYTPEEYADLLFQSGCETEEKEGSNG